ncbi:MAG: exodeoxyribonuclease VII large subunit [Chitinivibrionales bacterium]|nr:exodeoxyribonuclease VII large subunit [Chitinivibrionales bacterium]MBD3355944.1 exodeoxyribonuclease VII large subunit [Chitinivibrionales bacterium]
MNESFEFLSPLESEKPYTVSEINEGISMILDAGNTLVWVEGEISNFKRAASGHCYLKLQDADSRIPGVIWRSTADRMDFEPEEGMAVLAIAAIRVYTRGGYYQLDVRRMQPSGLGAIFAAIEKLKAKLDKEGLFDACHKKRLPETPKTIGVVTAKTGAALRDIIRVVASRSPGTDILLRSVPVQGDPAPAAIAHAIAEMNEQGAADLLIVGRGGGSVEDLWAFNDERVARAIFASKLPVISAVGHEIDFTIADFVADVRAPTPSAAAEMAVPDHSESLRHLRTLIRRFVPAAKRRLREPRTRLMEQMRSRALRKPFRLVEEYRLRQDELTERHARAMGIYLRQARTRMARAASHLGALNPLSVLARGYSVVTDTAGRPIRDAGRISVGDTVGIKFRQGRAQARITKVSDA